MLVERSFDGLFSQVDSGAARFFFIHAEGGHALHQLSDAPRFTQKLRFGVLQFGRCLGLLKTGFGTAYEFAEGIRLNHKFSCTGYGNSGAMPNGIMPTMKKGQSFFKLWPFVFMRKQLLIL